MSGLEEANTKRAQQGQMIHSLRTRITMLVRNMEESVRDPMLAMRTTVEDDVDGDYQRGDLEFVNTACMVMHTQLTNLADSFTPAP